MSDIIVIAVDGPAASGKGTVSQGLAAMFGFAHLDTGKLYRAVTAKLLDQGIAVTDLEAHVNDGAKIAASLDSRDLDRDDLRTERVSTATSVVSQFPEVRSAIRQFQQDFAKVPPDGKPGAVLDGRDIGTVICPDADVKIFVDASAETRAERRTRELVGRGETAQFAEILKDMLDRDDRDRNRPVSPMKPADDAYLLDTTNLDIEASLTRAKEVVLERVPSLRD